MTDTQFRALIVDLLDRYPQNAEVKRTLRVLDTVGAPQPMTDTARAAWQRDSLVVAGLRHELHRLT